jgi:hypothetical protein
MSQFIYTPTKHQVFNSFDDHGISLGLERLLGETNVQYKQRLIDVMAHRANCTQQGLIWGITRELGLSLYDAMTVECLTDANGDYLLTQPAIEFEGNICRIISDANPNNQTVLQEVDLFDRSSSNYYLGGLIDTINNTGYFTATISSEADPWSRSMCIFKQSNIKKVVYESLDSSANKFKLKYNDIVAGTVSVQSGSLVSRKSTADLVLKPGDYHVDLSSGLLSMRGIGDTDGRIRYQYRENPITFGASPVIVNSLQRDPFRKKLFVQVENELGEEFDSFLTNFGLSTINELYSVVPMYWGK